MTGSRSSPTNLSCTRKDRIAPWWPDNSKEAYSSGLDALARGLKAFADSRAGTRRGPAIAFPRFKSRRRARASCRFTTGAIRVGDRSHVVLPRIGRVRTHEPATALLDKAAAGRARVLAATVSFDGRRWYCSFTVDVARQPGRPAHAGVDRAHPVIGVDAGVRDLLVAAAPDGAEVARVPAPRSLARAQVRLRAAQRKAARQAGPDRRTGQRPSRRWRRTSARIARIHARAANIRRDALHKAATALAQRHQVIVIEDLAVADMIRRKPGAGRGGRGLNRALADAGLGELRRQLGYKATWYGSALLVADRWYPSSKTCSACGRRKPSLTLAERTWTCASCGATHDRDRNAATNLARLSEHTAVWKAGPPGVARWQDVEPPRRPRPAGQEATKRQPGTSPRWTRPGPPLRKERLPSHEHSHSLTRRQR